MKFLHILENRILFSKRKNILIFIIFNFDIYVHFGYFSVIFTFFFNFALGAPTHPYLNVLFKRLLCGARTLFHLTISAVKNEGKELRILERMGQPQFCYLWSVILYNSFNNSYVLRIIILIS